MRRVGNRDFGFLAGAQRARQRHLEFAIGSLERGRLAANLDAGDFELRGVELEAGDAVEDRSEAMRCGAGDRLRSEIERDLELDMPDVCDPVARPLRLDVRGLERAAFARQLRAEGITVADFGGEMIEETRLVHEPG